MKLVVMEEWLSRGNCPNDNLADNFSPNQISTLIAPRLLKEELGKFLRIYT